MKPATVHHFIEHRLGFLIFGILLISMFGGLAQILPSLFDDELATPAPNLKPYTATELAGREVYLRESCALCHTQHVRALLAEVRRYGPSSKANEFVYDRPFLWGSKRTGPDLHRLAGKYSDAWHRVHLINPRSVVAGSIMPSYPWLKDAYVNVQATQKLMLAFRVVGIDYTDEQISAASTDLYAMSELDALIVYLQSLGAAAANN